MAVAHVLLVDGVQRGLAQREGDFDEAGVSHCSFSLRMVLANLV
jgi:hypothetical protein